MTNKNKASHFSITRISKVQRISSRRQEPDPSPPPSRYKKDGKTHEELGYLSLFIIIVCGVHIIAIRCVFSVDDITTGQKLEKLNDHDVTKK